MKRSTVRNTYPDDWDRASLRNVGIWQNTVAADRPSKFYNVPYFDTRTVSDKMRRQLSFQGEERELTLLRCYPAQGPTLVLCVNKKSSNSFDLSSAK
jgi:hypothetical protein